ncbi:MAG TPA: tRNA uridine-5-carboxymethylaminomethyl(34) synthesis GTPase MnmE, partial [Steroidobacteraceae bacterium]|nr:tRNA uridine-5-carboxymethylaminomethyl(34) synthesis GTPase MnmE [Steroidobacteraceae bacterium]
MNSDRDPIVAIATAPGRGGIGIVRLSGVDLTPILSALLARPTLTARHATFTRFLDAAGNTIDEGIALFYPAPHSYTGESVLELQGH